MEFNIVVFCSLLVASADSLAVPRQLNEGDACTLKSGKRGTCKIIDDCEKALTELDELGKWPEICKYENYLPVVCCENVNGTGLVFRDPETTTSTSTTTTTQSPDAVGRVAKQKCNEYSSWQVEEPPILLPEVQPLSTGKCKIVAAQLIVGGERTQPGEFAHMVRLGYKDADDEDISWGCGGSLISDRYVLTAAHCTRNRDGINVTHAKFSDEGASKEATIVKIVDRIRHPSYKPPKTYNDIALLKLEISLTFNDYLRPACIQTEANISAIKGIATGWGAISYGGVQSNTLLKVELPIIGHQQCSRTYTKNNGGPRLPYGLNQTTMICSGEIDSGKDTCQGDSGGPLQIILNNPECMYSIIGVTSFGQNCGLVPGVYTRVSQFVSWIETIVWETRTN